MEDDYDNDLEAEREMERENIVPVIDEKVERSEQEQEQDPAIRNGPRLT